MVKIKKVMLRGCLLLACMPSFSFGAVERRPMEMAIRAGNVAKVEELVSKAGGIDALFCEKNGYTCLMDAADYGQEEIVDFCIRNGASLDVQDKRGHTTLMWSLAHQSHHKDFCISERRGAFCRARKLKLFYALLSHGADYSIVNLAGKSIVGYIKDYSLCDDVAQMISLANQCVSERVYRVGKILSRWGDLLPDIILEIVLPYMYGDIEAHNKHPDKFLVVDRDRFFRQKLACALAGRRRLYKDKHLSLRITYPMTEKKEGEMLIDFISEDCLFSEEEMVSARPVQKKDKWSCFPWCSTNK